MEVTKNKIIGNEIKIINFPENMPIGVLAKRKIGSSKWKKWKDSSGTIEIEGQEQLALSLLRTKYTDLSPLAFLPENAFDALDLGWTRIGDIQLMYIAHLKITELDLGWTRITNDGVSLIRHMVDLRMLKLTCTFVTDRCLKDISNLKRLERLVLRGTNITDDGIEYLVKLTHLKQIDIQHTKISERGIQKLKQRKSDLEIII